MSVSSGNRTFTIWVEWAVTRRAKASEADVYAIALRAP
jgi:hypothetical protein